MDKNNKLIITEQAKEYLTNIALYSKILAYGSIVINAITIFYDLFVKQVEVYEVMNNCIVMGGSIFLLLFSKRISDAIFYNDTKLLMSAFSYFTLHLIVLAATACIGIFIKML